MFLHKIVTRLKTDIPMQFLIYKQNKQHTVLKASTSKSSEQKNLSIRKVFVPRVLWTTGCSPEFLLHETLLLGRASEYENTLSPDGLLLEQGYMMEPAVSISSFTNYWGLDPFPRTPGNPWTAPEIRLDQTKLQRSWQVIITFDPLPLILKARKIRLVDMKLLWTISELLLET